MPEANTTIQNISLQVGGMNCTNCSLGLKKALEDKGLSDVDSNFATGELSFKARDEGQVRVAIRTIQKLGYYVIDPDGVNNQIGSAKFNIETKFRIAAFFTIPLIVSMFIPVGLLHNPYTHLLLAAPVFVIGLVHFGNSAFRSIRSGIANMDVLIFMGSTTAFGYSLVGTIYNLGHQYMFYETAASIITIVLFGNMLEQRAIKKTTGAVEALTKMQPLTAKRIKVSILDKIETIDTVSASSLHKGDLVMLNTGDRVPVDGEIYWGRASINEAMVSGESFPCERTIGDRVIGGTIIEQGSIKMKATAVGKETLLSQIIEMVRDAQKDKPKLQNLADRISMVFVPIVIVIAVGTWLLSYFLFGVEFKDALMRGVAVMVIACPCALGLAIPTAVVAGLGRSAREGILLKGVSVIDKLTDFDKIIFDKTGTLTTGVFKVKKFKVFNELSQQEFISLLCSLEKHSSHPIAVSLVNEYKGFAPKEFVKVIEEKGLGITAWDKNGNVYRVGSHEIAIDLTDENTHNIYVTANGKLIGWVDLEDQIKSEAPDIIRYFKNRQIETIMLSGDRDFKCRNVAKELGIDIVFSEKRPHEKIEIVTHLSTTSKVVMVGDGINDAPALARSYAGISLSNATQLAIQSADLILLKGDLNLLPISIEYSKKIKNTIKENLFWAFFYNVMAIPLAIIGLLNPLVAAVVMSISSLLVVLNSIRLSSRRICI